MTYELSSWMRELLQLARWLKSEIGLLMEKTPISHTSASSDTGSR